MIFLSCGFDGMAGDPTKAGCNLTSAFYAAVATECTALCPERVVVTLQGGYQASAVADASMAVLKALTPRKADVGSSASQQAAIRIEGHLAPPMAARLASVAAAVEGSPAWGVRQSFDHGCT